MADRDICVNHKERKKGVCLGVLALCVGVVGMCVDRGNLAYACEELHPLPGLEPLLTLLPTFSGRTRPHGTTKRHFSRRKGDRNLQLVENKRTNERKAIEFGPSDSFNCKSALDGYSEQASG